MGVSKLFRALGDRVKIADFRQKLHSFFLLWDFNSLAHPVSQRFLSRNTAIISELFEFSQAADIDPTGAIDNASPELRAFLEKHNIQQYDLDTLSSELAQIFNLQNCNNVIIDEILQEVVKIIQTYFTRDLQYVYFALDGVPSLGKLNEQRSRRHIGAIVDQLENNFFEDMKSDLTPVEVFTHLHKIRWTNRNLTPGTAFMKLLTNRMRTQLPHLLAKYGYRAVIHVSGPDEYGEGEKKIMDFIEREYQDSESRKATIISPDADMFLLSIPKNAKMEISVLRHDQQKSAKANRDVYSLIDINYLSQTLCSYVKKYGGDAVTNFEPFRIADDIMFAFVLFGNDFLPPVKTIVTGKIISGVVEAYADALLEHKQNLIFTKGGKEEKMAPLTFQPGQGKYQLRSNVLLGMVDTLAKKEEILLSNSRLIQYAGISNAARIIDVLGLGKKASKGAGKLDRILSDVDAINKEISGFITAIREQQTNLSQFKNTKELFRVFNFLGLPSRGVSFTELVNTITNWLQKEGNTVRELKKFAIIPKRSFSRKGKDFDDYQTLKEKVDAMKSLSGPFGHVFGMAPDDWSHTGLADYYQGENVNEVCRHYFYGLNWVFHSYFNGDSTPSTYQYPYHFAPLMHDLLHYMKSRKNVIRLIKLSEEMFVKDIAKIGPKYVGRKFAYMNPVEQLVIACPFSMDTLALYPREYRNAINSDQFSEMRRTYYLRIKKVSKEITKAAKRGRQSKEIVCGSNYFLSKCDLVNLSLILKPDLMQILTIIREILSDVKKCEVTLLLEENISPSPQDE